jgi:hypothetical protein
MNINAKMFSQRAAPIGAEGSVLCGAEETGAAEVSSPEAAPEPPPAEGKVGALGAVGACGILGAVGALGILTLSMALGKPTISTYLVAETGLIEDEKAQGEDE